MSASELLDIYNQQSYSNSSEHTDHTEYSEYCEHDVMDWDSGHYTETDFTNDIDYDWGGMDIGCPKD